MIIHSWMILEVTSKLEGNWRKSPCEDSGFSYELYFDDGREIRTSSSKYSIILDHDEVPAGDLYLYRFEYRPQMMFAMTLMSCDPP